jgi:quercetin 2,3-dioxygenase
MRGFQLWINLPANEKMKPARYRDIPARDVPILELASGVRVKVIAGTVRVDGRTATGPVNGPAAPLRTDPLYLDVDLPAGTEVSVPVTAGHNLFLYVFEGEAHVGPKDNTRTLPARAAGIVSDGDSVRIEADARGARLLLLAGRPLNEPVVQYGPFVMNTRQEIERALDDFRNGRFAA